MNQSKCPVPREQQPTNEFIELSKSKIFSWPKTKKSLILILIKFWVGAFVLFLVISSGSVYFKTSLLKYIKEIYDNLHYSKTIQDHNIFLFLVEKYLQSNHHNQVKPI